MQATGSLAELARLIVDNAHADAYRFYIVLAALALIIVAASAVVAGFFREQVKLIASSAVFQKTLDQLVRTTERTELVKIRMAHSDWTSKELRTLRRMKLEELVIALFTAVREIETHITDDEITGSVAKHSQASMSVIDQLSALYFPELEGKARKLGEAYVAFTLWRLDHHRALRIAYIDVETSNKILNIKKDTTPYDAADVAAALADYKARNEELTAKRREMADQFKQNYSPFSSASHELLNEAKLLMAELVKPVEYVAELGAEA